MSGRLEEELVRVLSRAAADAPLPGEGFAPAVLRRQQSRRRHRYALAAGGCAVVLAATVGVTMLRPAGPGPEPAAAKAWTGEVPDFETAQPAERVWPDATHRLPGTLPDGSGYAVKGVLGDGRYLVGPPNGVSSGKLAVFDVPAGTVRVLSHLRPKAQAKAFEATVLGVAGDYAIWTVGVNPTSEEHTIEVWSAPLDGTGDAELLTTLDGRVYLRVAGIAGDLIALCKIDRNVPTTFYLLSPAGGTPREVAGSERFDWAGLWPWVRSGDAFDDPGGELLNLVTGDRLTWRVHPKDRGAFCDPVLCLGVSRGGNKWTAYRLDGSGYRELPYDYLRPGMATRFSLGSALQGRIGIWSVMGIDGNTRQVVWDRFTGKAGGTPLTKGGDGTMLQWADGQQKVVLDLTAIK